ncbi:RNA-binding protein NOB1-like [Neolamprologus brichardi]|uniref:RNA-binding protein NOB1-like n=1 Tax=Neolamprologus brichardi TaxID=32507 RepID=UPI001643BBC7|nr:RNA-binding protein NOB1-like [Neolamprologus brichardi]
MNRAFCPHCGNRTLKKLAVTVNEDGSMQMHFSKNPKVLNPRGLRHTLPLPQGGKHSTNPHLVEDQRFPQQRLSRKARQKTDVFNPTQLMDYNSQRMDYNSQLPQQKKLKDEADTG